ncbi:MAG: double zinc ribbon domain-containing protein [Longimicrobiales bacterium]
MTSRSLATDLLDLLLPRGCLACGERIPPEEPDGLTCSRCRSRLQAPTPPFCPRCQLPRGTGHAVGEACEECARWAPVLVSARAAVVLDEVSGPLVRALKYRGWSGLVDLMSRMMVRDLPPGFTEPTVVPVPTTPWRCRTRGYNQAALLAAGVARRGSLPLVEALRREGGRTQVELGPRERTSNVRGAFRLAANARSRIRGREVILVDDVLTTGATATAAARTLESGGVARVALLTFARSLPFTEGEGR